ncbi:methyl-accepting chemotaxis protein [Litorilituus lipolyticus]|uniref:Methyl-accepting chemotaxis protein n=1 Tax=Litorilituus lipolyticus TaxID=2491017 RepID=A0A502KQL0_9GAMM|nr:methyl-accepting chemotaxis protein [Litorilituus lipolyticus]TPH12485.1 methyl-accepting chemotaxis protein [Litorilituus lipolyticus]
MILSKSAPLSTKITLLFALLIATCIVILSYVSSNSLEDVSEQQLNYMEDEVKKSVLSSLERGGTIAGNKVATLLKQSFSIPLTLAQIFSDSAIPQKPFSREKVKKVTHSALKANEAISSLYTHLEKDGYDGLDDQNRNNFEHSSNTGALEIYWVRENGQTIFYPTEDAGEKYIETINESGMRESEWYLCPRDKVTPCALDPYLYEIEPGKSELLTTLSAPIISQGKFIGIVGADINLPVVQTWIEQASTGLFNGKSMLTLISQNNIIVASTKYKDLVGQPVTKGSNQLLQFAKSSEKTHITDENWQVKVDVNLEEAGVTWKLIVSIPKEVAMMPVISLKKASDETYTSAITSLVIHSILFLAVAVGIAVWLAKSISSPIKSVSDSVQNLSSQEGDLTQKVHIQNHEELIRLASGLNDFMNKLANIIGGSKAVSQQLVGLMAELDSGAEQVKNDTDNQQMNLDNMATAINEMSVTAMEVSRLSQDTATNASDANDILTGTQSSLQGTVTEIEKLSINMTETGEQIEKVAERTQNITSIVSTIQSIAEQTNLLALNAAIEAARAGEMGRGFAVVADEVRNLASRTQTSTTEISDLIQFLQTDVDVAVGNLTEIKQSVDVSVDATKDSFEQLANGVTSINAISDSSVQVATAAEEQSQVSEEVNMQVVAISDSSKQLAEMGETLSEMSARAQELINDLNAQLNLLKSE